MKHTLLSDISTNVRSEIIQRKDMRMITRRRVMGLGVGAVASLFLKDGKEISAFSKIGNYTADPYAHNSDTLKRIREVDGLRIETDWLQLPPENNWGQCVVGHSYDEFYSLKVSEQLRQATDLISDEARRVGSTELHIDAKEITHAPSFIEQIQKQEKKGPVAVSTPHHDFLWNLAENEFDGRILFTLSNEHMVKNFIKNHPPHHFEGRSFGVSIQYLALNKKYGEKLKDRGLYILAWTPNSARGILHSLESGADGITSDDTRLLKRIGQNVKTA